MRITVAFACATLLAVSVGAQEEKPVPKNSVRVFVPGCSKGRIFTAALPTEDQQSGSPVPVGMHLRMNGPKKLMDEIKGVEGSKIEITGLMKKGQYGPGGVSVGSVRITGGPSAPGGGMAPNDSISQTMIDVEGWRRVTGDCPSH